MTVFLIVGGVLIAVGLITALAIFVGKVIALGNRPQGGPR